MSRLDESIKTVEYILECLVLYKKIMETGDCNDCKKRYKCKYLPGLGELVRFNCPHYRRNENERSD